jgi:polysaccharide export outer membrane protein
MFRLRRMTLSILVILFLAGYSQLYSQAPPPERPSQYVLGPDDQIKIWVLGVEEISDKPVRIDPSGDIDLPVAGKLQAGGLTIEELKAKLVERLAKSLLHPQVSVEMVDFGSQPVSVMGAVNHPGVHQLGGRKTLAEVLALAGGTRPDAGPRVTISRQIRYGPIPLRSAKPDPTGDFSVADVEIKELLSGAKPADNIPIHANDLISVPTAEVIYVIGEVRKPGEVTLKDQSSISVLQALSSAEGFGPTPAPQNAKIVRLAPGSKERAEIPVDLQKVLAGKAEDIQMRPNDILVVPLSGPKRAAARAMEAAIQTVTGVIIWRRP